MKELANHPDKNWVSWLLRSIQDGVQIGYKGSRHPLQAKNLLSSRFHPEVIRAELDKGSQLVALQGHSQLPPSQTSNVLAWVQYQKKGANSA